ncbi:ROK family protein [Vibrio sp. WXL103]|uniref:ROK family protein n=1 Tax=Vibrio sp. WXL103 TaxID=3450710 RepID=UPI003EC8B483
MSNILDGYMLNDRKGIIAFDIGGTWFRSGVVEDNQIKSINKSPSISVKNNKGVSAKILQEQLVQFIIDKRNELLRKSPSAREDVVAISLGAAMNGKDSHIYNSGPLWGDIEDFDLMSLLEERVSTVRWCITNDVTASLRHHKEVYRDQSIFYMTISSGIASRYYDHTMGIVPIDSRFGLQGEVGHLTTHFTFQGKKINLRCDCGKWNHVNAFCSGNGIDKLITHLVESNKFELSGLGMFNYGHGVEWLSHVKDKNYHLAYELVREIVRPIAKIILYQMTLVPQTSKIILSGGVVKYLSDFYIECLLEQIEDLGFYQILEREPNYFRNLITIDHSSDNTGMLGAALFCKDSD